jgi:predicted nuclease of predicted toxin-antitoxin system
MKLLFDHNLSPRLVNQLADLFPESAHLYTVGMDQADDTAIVH